MVATRAQISAVAAARPAARLDGLPVDLLAHIATHVALRVDLLALRCVSRPCQDAVRRAAKEHPVLDKAYFRLCDGSTARAIEVWGRVFGSGCRKLDLYGGHDPSDVPSSEELDALRSVVVNTQGCLRELQITYLRFSNSRDYALELCRASPQLKELVLHWTPSGWGDGNGVTSAAIDSFAMEVSRLCPLLEKVELSDGYSKALRTDIGRTSPAETWQRHFPAIKCLDFRGSPDRYAAIEATARACVCAEEVSLSECTVSPALVDVLVRSPLRDRLRKLDLSFDTIISNESILQFARVCGALKVLELPLECDDDPEFYRSLAQLRPTLTSLDLGMQSRADDECLQILCESLSLEHLTFSCMEDLSPAVIGIILQSTSAQTLRSIEIYYMHDIFTPPNLLRLVRGCPLLSEFGFDDDSEELLSPIEHGETVDAINELFKSRGGKEDQYLPFIGFGPSLFSRPQPRESDVDSESGED